MIFITVKVKYSFNKCTHYIFKMTKLALCKKLHQLQFLLKIPVQ